ncbi:MAG TPA: PAS domain-containing protein [Pseudolabrys sp.]|nr:PAS domain-containing protein [Pseudolabrys sp.]
MEFDMSRPDVVRAVNQRWLLKIWSQNLDGHRVPRWQAFEAERLTTMQENLSFLDVVPGEDGGPRFLIRFHGEIIRRAYGSPDGRGRYLDEILTPAICPTGIAPYEKAAREGLPVYTILEVNDRQGRQVHAERLLLPFAGDGEAVDRILAAFEFICDDGAFDSHAIMQGSEEPVLRLSALIEARV